MRTLFASTEPKDFRCDLGTLSIFTKQLSVLVSSGVVLHEALDSLVDRTEGARTLGSIIVPDLCYLVSSGHRFSQALAAYPKVFPKTYIALVQASEESGQLVAMLERVGIWLDTRERLSRQVKKALIYPAFVVCLTGILTLVMFQTFVPQILSTVIELGAELPLLTQIVVWLTHVLNSPVFWFVGLNATALSFWYLRSEEGRRALRRLGQYTPIVGVLLQSSDAAKYSLTLSILYGAGVDTLKAVTLAALASSSYFYQTDCARVVKCLRAGEQLADSLAASELYPRLLVDVITVGEETGRMPTLLGHCAKILEEDTRHRLDILVDLLEPMLLGGLSLLVGGIMVAVMLPMSSLLSAL